MTKRKAYQANIDDLLELMNNSLTLDNNEYDLLMTAFNSRITDDNIDSIIRASTRRYVRYLRVDLFQHYQNIEAKINMYLQKNNDTTRHLYIRFLEMK